MWTFRLLCCFICRCCPSCRCPCLLLCPSIVTCSSSFLPLALALIVVVTVDVHRPSPFAAAIFLLSLSRAMFDCCVVVVVVIVICHPSLSVVSIHCPLSVVHHRVVSPSATSPPWHSCHCWLERLIVVFMDWRQRHSSSSQSVAMAAYLFSSFPSFSSLSLVQCLIVV